eukprot:CAMPEP_0115000596 /NCGR_PEP_ID=MMETSP0216-20121206/16856_1 /TAXON_ID=223996 /ORGANISM="Protocruzia adherens, Strain Boccale" /LENGTH=388 /DNA_ID=CAMNT_0002365733 /DNA_START=54 /DNA_END=1220 /DNA_ORIENTATION=-
MIPFLSILFLLGTSSTALHLRAQTSLSTSSTPENCITVFTEANYQGSYINYCNNSSDLSTRDYNDIISSITFGSNISQISLYLKEEYEGEAHVFTSSVENLAEYGIDDDVSSLRILYQEQIIYEQCVILYDECYYQGEEIQVCDHQEWLDDLDFNDLASSIRMGQAVEKVILYQLGSYEGEHTTFTNDQECLKGNDLDDDASSMKMWAQRKDLDNSCVRVWDQCYYSGRSHDFCVRDLEVFLEDDWSDQISSIQLGSKVHHIVLYEDSNYEGDNIQYNDSVECLNDDDWGDTASSMKITFRKLGEHCLRVYTNCDFDGNFTDFCESQNWIGRDWTDEISCFRMGDAVKSVTMYKESDFSGYGTTYTHYESCLEGSSWNDAISSIGVLN